MTDTPDPYTSASHDVAARLAIPGGRQPSIYRVAATGGGTLPAPLARLLLDTHTSVGDVALDIDDDITFAAVAAAASRRHHALAGERHLATLGHAAGYIDLILLHWPRPATNPRLLLLACCALLRDVGVLAIAATVKPDQRISQLSALSGAATSAGLRLIDHIIGVDTSAGTATPAAAPRGATSRRAGIPAVGVTTPPLLPHTDLLIFSPAGGAR